MKKFFKALTYAFHGLQYFFSHERHALVHAIISVLVILAGLYFSLHKYEWLAIFLAIGMVFSAEIINTAIEEFADTLHPDKSAGIKHTKDLAAAAVLVCSIIAVVIGLVIFSPRLGII